MKTFTMTQLAQETGMVADAVDKEAATITRRGRPRYVILSYDEFERMKGGGRGKDPRRVLRTDETPDDIRSLLSDEIDRAVAEGEHEPA